MDDQTQSPRLRFLLVRKLEAGADRRSRQLDDLPDLSVELVPVGSWDEALGALRSQRFDGVLLDTDLAESEAAAARRAFDGDRTSLPLAVCQTDGDKQAATGPLSAVLLATSDRGTGSLLLQLFQAQKLDAMGQLAGAVAHELNNILAVVLGYGELLQQRLGPGDSSRQASEIVNAARRASSLTGRLLAFSRSQVLEPGRLDLNRALTEMEEMLLVLLGENVRLTWMLGDDLPAVRVDPSQLRKVVRNLARNARTAMLEGGELTIATSSRPPPASYVTLTVRDTGEGIESGVLHHLFEPFVTTKERVRGAGLGLAVVHGIVTQSGGHITVRSDPGRGSSFEIHLPAVPVLGERAHVLATGAQSAELSQLGSTDTETILLVEDDRSLRSLLAAGLVAQRYFVLEASDVTTAVEISEQHPGPIHLLLTDVGLPDGGGLDLAVQLRSGRPDLRVLFMSGSIDRSDAESFGGRGVRFLQKPFTLADASLEIRELLGSS